MQNSKFPPFISFSNQQNTGNVGRNGQRYLFYLFIFWLNKLSVNIEGKFRMLRWIRPGISIFMPPLKKGAYCFATVGWSACWSFGLLTKCCPLNIFWPLHLINIKLGAGVALNYWFSGHMFKSQGQTTLLSPLCCPLNIFWSLHLINIPNLVQGLPSMSRWSLLIFRSLVQRSRPNYSFEPSVLSTLYILILCSYRKDNLNFVPRGA